MAARDNEEGCLEAAMKFSDNPEKTTNPGVKQVWRIKDSQGMLVADVLALDEKTAERIEEGKTYTFWHPSADYRNFSHTVAGNVKPLLQKRLEKGKLLDGAVLPLAEVRNTVQRDLESLDHSYKRFLNPHIYKVSITEALRDLKLDLIKYHIRSF
jgi:nicotinate phosphoribosyltransferase